MNPLYCSEIYMIIGLLFYILATFNKEIKISYFIFGLGGTISFIQSILINNVG
jgi:hypothetical protein